MRKLYRHSEQDYQAGYRLHPESDGQPHPFQLSLVGYLVTTKPADGFAEVDYKMRLTHDLNHRDSFYNSTVQLSDWAGPRVEMRLLGDRYRIDYTIDE